MKTIYLGIFLMACTVSLTAQNLWLGAEGQRFYDELVMRKAVKGEVESYEGSPYMDEEFTEATIVSSKDQVFNKVPLRYNIYYDLFEVQMDEGIFNLNRGGVVTKVDLQGHTFIYTAYDYQSIEGEGYLELIIEGKYTLYKQYQIVFREAEPAQPYQEAKPAMFQERDPLFYIACNDNRPVFIKNKRSLEEIAGDNEKDLRILSRTTR
jgi:hypothetical protein